MLANRLPSVGVIWLLVGSMLVGALKGEAAEPPVPRPIPADRLPATLDLQGIPAGLVRERPVPADNLLTPARVELGRRLFFDARLSADHTVACASCHDPRLGFADPEPTSVGVGGRRGTRNAPSILNRAYGTSFFWDGREPTLEAQALKPIENPLEMNVSVATVVERLAAEADYRAAFAAAYGEVSAENLAKALASFERVLLSGNSRVDQFRAGNYSALSDAARQGLWLFESRGRCWQCHRGANFTDESFHNTGVSWGREPLDLGQFDVTQRDADRGRFHTPSLRDVARTAPYMHDGSVTTLRDVVRFYSRGGQLNPNLDPLITPLELTDTEIDQLVAFLEALTGEPPVVESPRKEAQDRP